MRCGLSFLPDVHPTVMSPTEYFANALALCAMADHAGLHSIKMTEHLLHPYGGYCPSPLAFFAAVAARTRSVRLITGGVLPSFHHPLQLAAETAMVDAISEGRLEVGFARGYMPYEFAALGVPIDQSRERFVATVETVLRLWTEESVSVDTPFFSFRDATCLPRPTQRPHPPVWVAASLSPESFAWIGRKGFKLMATFVLADRTFLKELIGIYREAFQSGGTTTRAAEIAVSLPLYVAESDTRAREEGGRYLTRYFDVWEDAANAWEHARSGAYPGYAHLAQVIRASTPEHLQRAGSAVFGCPARVADHVAWLAEELRIDHVMWQVDFGAMPRETAVRSLGLFINEVMPRLHALV
ncbi:MAG: LLM class flavin-dependent oxidoreductase [Deltaproteobacteria bacterium]|nr:LLM class flavin-dependent oxidoreductase [Deltaproteobacteria bacterium]